LAITLTEKPDLKSVPKPVRDKVTWDGRLNTLTITTPLTEDEADVLKASVTSDSAAAAIVEAAEISRTTAIEFFQTPAELGERFRAPQLVLRVQGELQLFDDPELLDHPWDLSTYDAAPNGAEITALGAGLKVSEGGEIDVDDASGQVLSRFLPDLQRDLGLVYPPEHWDEVRLATWLCRKLPEPSLTHSSKQAFVAKWLSELLRREGFTLARANLQKFLLRNLLEARIRDLRRQAVGKAFQQALFGDAAASRVVVTDQWPSSSRAKPTRPAVTTTAVSGTSTSASTSMDASATSTARRSSSVPAGWTFRRSRGASVSGCATSFGAQAGRSSCRRPTGASTRTSCVSFRVAQTSPARSWPSSTRARTAGPARRTTG
jgi:type III restriction enzyme